MKTKTLGYVPFTGLGLYGGFRGNRWLRNRIKIFKQFVIPALENQADKDFVLWVGWRPEERDNSHVIELATWLESNTDLEYVFTFGGLCFWDDKYEDGVAMNRLSTALHKTLPSLIDATEGCEFIDMVLVPSDDLYHKNAFASFKHAFNSDKAIGAVTFEHGYICNYHTKEVLEYNPNTNPPFFAIRFPREIFFDPAKHVAYTGPYKSHEYIGNALKLAKLDGRGFMVGTHGENISTHFNHPFGGRRIDGQEYIQLLKDFGIHETPKLSIPWSFRKWFMRQLPHNWRRKVRYIFGEKLYEPFYKWMRN